MNLAWLFIYFFGVSISLFLFLLLLTKKQKNVADKILASWLFFAFFDLILIGLYGSGEIQKIPKLIGWELPFPYLHGPFLYLYIVFISGQQKYTWHYLFHFIPAIIIAIVLVFLLPVAIVTTKGYHHVAPEFDLVFLIMESGLMISGAIYIILSTILLYRHNRNIKAQFSNTSKITLNWMQYLVFGMGVIWAIVITVQIPPVLFIGITLFIFFIGYFGIRQVGIFSNALSPHEVLLPKEIELTINPLYSAVVDKEKKSDKIKYEKTRLEDTERNRIYAELTQLMEDQKCYQNPDLTLGDLAILLTIPPGSLSQVINSIEGKNFYDYVNSFRVETFKRIALIPENRKYNLVSLAFECGFSSKTSFYRNFKKITNMSPSDYLRQNNINVKI